MAQSTPTLPTAASVTDLIGNTSVGGIAKTTRIPVEDLTRQLMAANGGALGQPSMLFQTVALMSAAFAGTPLNTMAAVWNDPVPANNLIYQRGAASWTSTGTPWLGTISTTANAAKSAADAAKAILDSTNIQSKWTTTSFGGPWGDQQELAAASDGERAWEVRSNGVTAVSELWAGSLTGPAFQALSALKHQSSTSLPLQIGRVELVCAPGLGITPGMRLRLSSRSSWAAQEGTVLAYHGAWLLMYIDDVDGSGTYSDWIITAGARRAVFTGLGEPSRKMGRDGAQYYREDTGALSVKVAGQWTQVTAGPILDLTHLYVAQGAMFGVNAGNDGTATGTPTYPYATVAAAVAAAPPGATIKLIGSPAAPPTYSAATSLDITKSVRIEPLLPRGAILSASAGTTIVRIKAAASGASVTFGALILDGLNARATLFDIEDTVANVNVTFEGTIGRAWTGTSIKGVGTSTRVVFTGYFEDFSSTAADTAFGLTDLAGGGIEHFGSRYEITQQKTSNKQVYDACGRAAGITYSAVNLSVLGTLQSTLAGAGTHYAMSVRNIRLGTIYGLTSSILGEVGSRKGGAFRLSVDTASALPSDGWVLVGLTLTSGCMSGYIFQHGEEGPSPADGLLTGSVLRHFTFKGAGNTAAQTGSLHGLLNGSRGDLNCSQGWIEKTGVAIADKGGSGAKYRSIVCVDAYQGTIALKGSLNALLQHITALQRVGIGQFVQYSENDTRSPMEDCSGCIVEGCNFVSLIPSSQAIYWLDKADGTGEQGVIMRYNNYWCPNGWGLNRFSRGQGGSSQYVASNALKWITDQDPTSTSVDPCFVDMANLDLRLSEPSLINGRVPAIAGLTMDFNDQPFRTPSSCGAFEI